MSTREVDKNIVIKNINKILKCTGYKTNFIYGTYYFCLFKKDKVKMDNRNYWFEYCITFYHEDKAFNKQSRKANKEFAGWENEIINMEELEIINKIVRELGWE